MGGGQHDVVSNAFRDLERYRSFPLEIRDYLESVGVLDYEHANNESMTGEEWERHWTEYIHERTAEIGTDVDVTSMHVCPGRSVAIARRYPRRLRSSKYRKPTRAVPGERGWKTQVGESQPGEGGEFVY